MIAVTFALPSESSGFIGRLSNRERTQRGGGIDVVTGGCEGKSVAVVHTGVGETATRTRLSAFFKADPPELLVSSGFAGALSDTWKLGELLIAQNVSSPEAFAAAARSLPLAKAGRLKSAPAIVDTPAARAEVARMHGADAVDMESEIIAEACAARGIPMLSLRAISDTPASPFPAPPAVLFDVERQRTDFAGLLFYMAKHPSSVFRFVTFAQQIAAARSALADALYLLISSGSLR